MFLDRGWALKALFFLLYFSVALRYLKITFGANVYFLVLVPLVLYIGLTFLKNKKIIFSSVDLVFSLFVITLTANYIMAGIRAGFGSQLIYLLYIYIPLLFYFVARMNAFSSDMFTKFLTRFSVIFALVTIIEFMIYALDPSAKGIITTYMRDVVQNSNFYPPTVQYPLIGLHTKPWGPMFDASAGGAFLAVLTVFQSEVANIKKTRSSYLSAVVLLVAAFLSGSKSAYLMVFIYAAVRYLGSVAVRPTFSKLFFLLPVLSGISICVVLFIVFFFSGEALPRYLKAFLEVPFNNLLEGIAHHGIELFFGLGQESLKNTIIGTGEVDFINSIFRYGVFFTLSMTFLLIYLAVKCFKTMPHFFGLFFMFVLAMNHYQVAFKFPASIILFIAVAVVVNEKSRRWKTNVET